MANAKFAFASSLAPFGDGRGRLYADCRYKGRPGALFRPSPRGAFAPRRTLGQGIFRKLREEASPAGSGSLQVSAEEIVTLQDALQVEPIPVRAVENAELPAADKGGEIALAGYAADRQYILSVHKGCDARIDAPERGVITHMCDSAPGESGAPILLLRDGGAVLIGIHSSNTQRFESQVGYQALAGRGVSAAEFESAAKSQRP
jgi:V8-like Glu-specific endopeptidase